MRATVSSLIVVLSFALASCKPADGGGDLRGSLPAGEAQGYLYSRVENNQQSAESLTNPAVVNQTPQPKGTTNVVVGYKRVSDKTSHTSRTYKTEARRAGNDVRLVVTDVANNEAVLDSRFPAAEPHLPSGPVFDSLQACIDDLLCEKQSRLQCEANRTCRDQFWARICCLRDGLCFSVHGVVRPNTLRCQVVGPVGDFAELVFSQQ